MNKKFLIGVLVVIAALLVGCSNGDIEGFGSLTVSMAVDSSRTIAPEKENLEISKHIVHGSLNNTKFFDTEFDGSSCTVFNLVAGKWEVFVSGHNAKGIEVARSETKTVDIVQNSNAKASFSLEYLAGGRGSVDLTVRIPSADSNVSKMEVTLTSIGGDPAISTIEVPRSGSKVVDDMSVFRISRNIDVGRYLVRFVMYDSKSKQVGFAIDEVLYVYKNQTSSFDWVWDKDYVPPVSTPVFDLEEGVYTDGTVVHIVTSEPGAEIHYTTDGSIPSSSSTRYTSDGVVLDRNMTIKAIAVKQGLVDSGICEAVYKVRVKTPEISLRSGTYYSNQEMSLTCGTSGAQIYYAIEGSSGASIAWVPYSDAVPADRNMSVKAYAAKENLESSDVATADYLFQCADPAFNLASCESNNALVVTMATSTAGGSIHYTIDGNAPTADSPVYSGPSVVVDGETTVKAFVTKDGWTPSQMVERTYTFVCSDPVFSIAPGSYSETQSVTMTTETNGSTIHYEVDGTTATPKSPVYAKGSVLNVSSDMHLSAIVVKDGYRNSNTVDGDYFISPQQTGIVVKDPVETDFRLGTPQGWFSGMYLYSGIEEATLFVDTVSEFSNVRWFYDGYEKTDLRGMESITVGGPTTNLPLELGAHSISLRVLVNGVSYTENLYFVVVGSEVSSKYVFWGDLMVGGTGPGGGYLVYDVDADNDSGNADGLRSRECGWKYIEVSKFDLGRLNGKPSIASSASRGDGFVFGYYRDSSGSNSFVGGASATSPTFGSGKENTSAITTAMADSGFLASSGDSVTSEYAANLCFKMVTHEGEGAITGWYLPSSEEMKQAIGFLGDNGLETISGTYWTSTETSASSVRTVNGSLDEGVGDKSQTYLVRPMRRF